MSRCYLRSTSYGEFCSSNIPGAYFFAGGICFERNRGNCCFLTSFLFFCHRLAFLQAGRSLDARAICTYLYTHSVRTLPRSVYEIAHFVDVVVVGPPGRAMAALAVLPSIMPPSVSSVKGACRNIPCSPPRLRPRPPLPPFIVPTTTTVVSFLYCSLFLGD